MKKALTGRPTRAAIGVQLVALAAGVALGIARGPSSTWDLPLIALLAGIAAISDLTAVETPAHRIKVSGSFLTIVVAIVLVGASAAAIVSVVSIAVGWTRTRYPARHLLINLVNYAWFPLIAGAAFEGLDSATGLSRHEPAYYLAVFALSLVALAINFAVLAAYMSYEERSRFWVKVRRALVPLLPSELVSACSPSASSGPTSSLDALAEMRRAAGTQLDGRLVEIFAGVLSHKDFAHRHGVDADFEREFALDRRIHDYVTLPPAP